MTHPSWRDVQAVKTVWYDDELQRLMDKSWMSMSEQAVFAVSLLDTHEQVMRFPDGHFLVKNQGHLGYDTLGGVKLHEQTYAWQLTPLSEEILRGIDEASHWFKDLPEGETPEWVDSL